MRSCKFIQFIMLLLYIRLDIFNSTIYSSLSLNCISSTLLLLCSSSSSSSSPSSSSNVFDPTKYKTSPSISSNTSKDLSYQSSINKINNNNSNNDNKKKKKKKKTNNKTNHQDVSLKSFNKQITYRLVEESNIPQFIGNLINDFQLTNYLLNYIFNNNSSSWNNNNNNNLKMNTINQSKPLLSIDLIANQYQIINNHHNNTDHHHHHHHHNELPRLYLFPSNQWSSKYFHINYYNLFKQELIQIKKLDRDQLCHWDYNPNNQYFKEINTCLCSINTCSIINNQSNLINDSLNLPYCQFTITIAMNLLSIGIELMTIHIQLIDLNDNYPLFQLFNKYELHFMEDALIGTKYQLPIAIDYDMCLYSNITYQLQSIPYHEINSIINNNNNQLNQSINYFSLIFNQFDDHNKLEIQLDHNLDREQMDKYELNLLAIDNHYQLNEIRHTTTLPLIIYIHDVNDCKPEFMIMKSIINNNNNHSNNSNSNEVLYQSNEPLLIEVCEDVPIGYVVTKFHAIDKDIGKNAEIQYRISQYTHSLTKSFFKLNSTTGELIIKESLDREKSPLSNGLHQLMITAYDQGIPQRSSNLFIRIKILDINDNYPMIHLIDETKTFQQSKFKQSPWYPINQSNNHNHNNHMIKINNQLINKMWQFINDNNNNNNQSINMSSIIDQLNNYSIHTKMIGNQPINTIINILIINDPDFNENGTVQCLIKNQLLIYSKIYQHSNNYIDRNYYRNDKQSFILLEPFHFTNPFNDDQQEYKEQKKKKIQFNSLLNEKIIKKSIEESKTGRKQDGMPVTTTTTSITINNKINITSNSNIDSFSNHNNYQLRTNMIFDPDKITDLYLLIECSDYGLPSLTTIQTIHFEIIHTFNDLHSLLNISHIQLINQFIIHDINCNYFNEIQKNSNKKSIFSNHDHLSLSKLIYPTLLNPVYMETKSSICLILMKGIQIHQQLFSIIVKTNYETNENDQILYELIKEIPNENYFTINSTSGIVSLMKELNPSIKLTTKQLLIQASKIGTLYDYSKDLNYKIQILINLTLNFNNDYSMEMLLSNDLVKDPDPDPDPDPDLVHNDHDQIIIYLQMNQSNSYIKTYTNDTYQFYITDSIYSNDSILSKIIVYCIQYSSSLSHNDHFNHHCELTLKVYDSLITMNEQDPKDFILKPIQFLCNNDNHNHYNRSNSICHGYQINMNHFIQHSLKNQYLLMITPTLISSKYSFKSIKIILYNIKNQYPNNQWIDKSFKLIQSINEPFNRILNQIGLKSPYCITNISISYKMIKDYKIMKLNQQNENMIPHRNKLIYILRHIWLLPKLYWMDNNNNNNNNNNNSNSNNNDNIEKEMKDNLKLWNGKPFLSLNPYTGILSVSRQLVLMDVGEYILYIDIQDYSQPELFNKTCIIFLNILPTELHQRPINDLPDSISYNPISRSSPYSTTSSSSLSSSSSVHSPLNPSISIDPHNGNNNNNNNNNNNDVYYLPEQNINFPIGNNQFMKTNKHLLLSTILITIVIIFIIIIIMIIMMIIYRNKCKSKLINQYKSNVNIIIDEQNQLLCLTSNHNEEILLKSINSSSSSNNNSNHSNHSSSSINMYRNSIYSHNEINHHYHSNDMIQFNNDLPITTNFYYTNGLYHENMGNSASSQVGYNMIHGNEPVYNWMNIIEDDQHLSNIHYTLTNHSVVNNFYKNYEDENQQMTLTETTSNM